MSHFTTPISDYAAGSLWAVTPEQRLSAAYEALLEHKVSSMPVLDADGRGLGILSMTDLLRIGRQGSRRAGTKWLLDLPDIPVKEAMTEGVITAPPATTVATAAKRMVSERIHRIYLEAAGKLTGVFTATDMLFAVRDARVKTPIGEAMSKPAFVIPVTAPLSLATDRLAQAHVTGLTVVDEDGWPVGLFTQREALEAKSLPGDAPIEDAMSYAMLCLHVTTPVFRAAAQAQATRARRVIAVEDKRVVGVMTRLDFARVAS